MCSKKMRDATENSKKKYVRFLIIDVSTIPINKKHVLRKTMSWLEIVRDLVRFIEKILDSYKTFIAGCIIIYIVACIMETILMRGAQIIENMVSNPHPTQVLDEKYSLLFFKKGVIKTQT